MFDGVDACFDGHAEAGAAQGVAHGAAAEEVGFLNKHVDLVAVELDVLGAVADAAGGTAGGGEFHDIGACADHLADFAADIVDAGGDSIGQVGVDVAVGLDAEVAGGRHAVGEAANG